MNRENIIKAFDNFRSTTDDYLGAFFIKIFRELPQAYRIYFDDRNKLSWNCSSEEFDHQQSVGKRIDDRRILIECLKEESENMITFCYSYHEWFIIYDDENTKFLLNITMSDNASSDVYIIVYTNDIENSFKILKQYVHPIKKNTDIKFGISAIDNGNSLYTSWYDYSNHEIDIKKNYNDDIPYDKMCSILKSTDKPELMLFYGEPGTGKSSLIKHFISVFPNNSFIFMDGSLLANVPQQSLMSYFLENQNTIFILEDCEKILVNREHNINPVMPILLNLTDGIIGDVLGIKLICTFNTSLHNIDKALIRKGRLSLKYEFKKLTKDKVQKITGNKDSKEMTLADIYYENEENDYSKKSQSKIGF